jgi:hypothetical protein
LALAEAPVDVFVEATPLLLAVVVSPALVEAFTGLLAEVSPVLLADASAGLTDRSSST